MFKKTITILMSRTQVTCAKKYNGVIKTSCKSRSDIKQPLQQLVKYWYGANKVVGNYDYKPDKAN